MNMDFGRLYLYALPRHAVGSTIPNLVFTSRVLFSDTHYPLITRITIMSSTVFILIIVYLQMSTLLLL